jgi:hypothetical protein
VVVVEVRVVVVPGAVVSGTQIPHDLWQEACVCVQSERAGGNKRHGAMMVGVGGVLWFEYSLRCIAPSWRKDFKSNTPRSL